MSKALAPRARRACDAVLSSCVETSDTGTMRAPLLGAVFLLAGVHGFTTSAVPQASQWHTKVARARQWRTKSLRLELGLQVDPLASAGSLFVLGGFAALQLKIRSAMDKREGRDAATETLRKAEVLLLAGKLSTEDVQRVRQTAQQASDDYEDARKIVALGGALLRVPDPTRNEAQRRLERQEPEPKPAALPPPAAPPWSSSDDPLDGVRTALRLEDRSPAASEQSGSLLPTGSSAVTLKDVAIGFVFVLQLSWFVLSLTDPMGTPNPLLGQLLTSGGEAVDRMEAKKAAENAEYRAMLQAAVDSGEAPPTCATRKLDDPMGGCASSAPAALLEEPQPAIAAARTLSLSADEEAQRTRGLDANRAWISGPQSSDLAR